MEKDEVKLTWMDRLIVPLKKEYKDFVRNLQDNPEKFYQDGEKLLSNDEKKFLKFYEEQNGKKLQQDFKFNVTIFNNKDQSNVSLGTVHSVAEFFRNADFENKSYIFKNITTQSEITISTKLEKEKFLSDLWALELEKRTDLSSGLSNSQIDERQSFHYRNYEIEAKKEEVLITPVNSLGQEDNLNKEQEIGIDLDEIPLTSYQRDSSFIDDIFEDWEKDQKENAVGKISFYNTNGSIGEVVKYTSQESYLKALESEIDSNLGGFKYETLEKNPELLKKVDDLIYNAYGEENPNNIEYYIEKFKNLNLINMEQKKFELVEHLKNQLKYLGFGESENLHKDLENGIKEVSKSFEIKLNFETTKLGNNVDFKINFGKSEQGGVFLNSYDANLTNKKNEVISQNFKVSKDNSFTAKEAINLLEGRSVKIEFVNPKTNQREEAFVRLSLKEEKNEYGNYNFQTFHKNYGIDVPQIVEKSNLIFDKPEYKDNTIKNLEKGNIVKVKFQEDGKTIDGNAVLNAQYKTLNLYDSKMTRINTNKPIQGLDSENTQDKSNARQQSISRGI